MVKEIFDYRIFIFAGVRVSELLSIRIKDFDFKNKSIKIIGKGKKKRFVPLADIFAKRIQMFVQQYNVTGYLFTNQKSKRLYSKKIYRIVKDHLSLFSTKTNNSPHIETYFCNSYARQRSRY